MYRCHHHVQRTYQATHCLLVCKWVFSSPLELPRPIIYFVMATLIQPLSLLVVGLPPWSREKRTAFS